MKFQPQVIPGSSVPIYKQIVDQVRIAIASGVLLPGQQVASVRSVADSMVVNPNTVARAYAELTREGLLASMPGKGAFVAERRQRYSTAERERLLDDAVGEFMRRVVLLDFSREEILSLLDRNLEEMLPAGGGG